MICPICGKPTTWSGTITFGSTPNTLAIPEMCQGHTMQMITYQSNSTSPIHVNCRCSVSPVSLELERTPIPQVFLDAFRDKELRP